MTDVTPSAPEPMPEAKRRGDRSPKFSPEVFDDPGYIDLKLRSEARSIALSMELFKQRRALVEVISRSTRHGKAGGRD